MGSAALENHGKEQLVLAPAMSALKELPKFPQQKLHREATVHMKIITSSVVAIHLQI